MPLKRRGVGDDGLEGAIGDALDALNRPNVGWWRSYYARYVRAGDLTPLRNGLREVLERAIGDLTRYADGSVMAREEHILLTDVEPGNAPGSHSADGNGGWTCIPGLCKGKCSNKQPVKS